jgi:hypothetical protein
MTPSATRTDPPPAPMVARRFEAIIFVPDRPAVPADQAEAARLRDLGAAANAATIELAFVPDIVSCVWEDLVDVARDGVFALMSAVEPRRLRGTAGEQRGESAAQEAGRSQRYVPVRDGRSAR